MPGDKRLPAETQRSLTALFCAQFLGALNDNLYKMVVSLLAVAVAIDTAGGSAYLSVTGAVFVAPYMLFSGYAGYLADRLEKRRVLILAKGAEVAIMALAAAALLASSIHFLLAVLFLMALQSVFFSPAKYGILPELLPTGALPRANGVLESSHYAAVILGTVLGGVLLTLWRDTPLAIGTALVVIAAAGMAAAVRIRPGSVIPATNRFQINPWAEVGDGLRRLAENRTLAWTVAGITCFDFVATLMTLDMLLVGKLVLGLDDLRVGLLGAAVGLGMALGCYAAGVLSHGRIELRLVPLGILGSGLAMVAIAASGSYALTTLLMVVAGAFGGPFVVPLYALLQARPGAHEKGRIIATNNFLNMAGVLAASAALWGLHDLLGVGPRAIVAGLGVVACALALLVLWALPELRPMRAGPAVPLRRGDARAGRDRQRLLRRAPAHRRQPLSGAAPRPSGTPSPANATALPLRPHVGMPPLDRSGRPASYFEFWPPFLFYLPIALYWLLLSIRHCSLTLPTIGNPLFRAGGLVGESKVQIMNQVAATAARRWVAPFIAVTRSTQADADLELALTRMERASIAFPVVAKPDIGCRGIGVRLINSVADLRRYLEQFPVEETVMLQRYVAYEAEAGVFYVRLPGETRGRIVSLTLKYFPYVIGDGRATLRDLILRDPRAGLIANRYLDRHATQLDWVIAAGQHYRLTFAGNHACGAIHRDGNAYITPAMNERFDQIARLIPEFYYGRFDVRCRTIADLQQGRSFFILEINGASAEPTHIWDRNTRLRDAYRALIGCVGIAFEIGRRNRMRGFQPVGPLRLLKLYRRERRLAALYPLTE